MTAGAYPTDCQATLTITLGKIIDNYQSCRDLAHGTECAAMVKADAYGMGIKQVAPALFHKAGCKIFFVANLAEAITLRKFVPKAVIYVLNGIFPGHEEYFIGHDIRPVLNDLTQVRLWAEISHAQRPPCAIHFDTGINRLGLTSKETHQFIEGQDLRSKLDISLVMSHLACSDQADNPMNAQQLTDFRAIISHFPTIPASLANSGGILLGPDYHFDLVRPGLLLFGGNPSRDKIPDQIKAPFRISGKILQIRDVNLGETVGYGASWTADRPSRLAIINIGYGDGYLQSFNNCGMTYLNQTLLPVIGRVSMDMIAVDLTDLKPDNIECGADVELLGPHITLEMAAEVSNLSQYEILTGVRERYQRIYK